MKKEFYQSHQSGGYRAKVTIEWEAPEDDDGTDWRLTHAEQQAEDIIAYAGPKTYSMVRAMRGHTDGPDEQQARKSS